MWETGNTSRGATGWCRMSLRRLVSFMAPVLMVPMLAVGITRAEGNAVPPQQPLDYHAIFNIIRNFRGLACPAGFLKVNCLSGGLDIASNGTLVLIGDNGDRSHTVPLLGLKAVAQTIGIDAYGVRLNDSWDLLTEIADPDAYIKSAQQLAAALTLLPQRALEDWGSLAVITPMIARAYRALPVKPVLGEDVRPYLVQAEDAVRQQRFQDASQFYRNIATRAPWWPGLYLNHALVRAELGDFHSAVLDMRAYLLFAPDAANARELQDKIYIWESQDRSGFVEPDPAWFLPPHKPGDHRMGVVMVEVPPIVAAARHLPEHTGVLILYVQHGAPAAAAGLAPEDIVLSLSGQAVTSLGSLTKLVQTAPLGTDLPLAILRGTQRQTLTLKLP
jgi:PDZ domain